MRQAAPAVSFKDMISFEPTGPKIKSTCTGAVRKNHATVDTNTQEVEECINKHVDVFREKIAQYEREQDSKARPAKEKAKKSSRGKRADEHLFLYETTSDTEGSSYSSDVSESERGIAFTAVYNVNRNEAGNNERNKIIVNAEEKLRLTRDLCNEGEEIVSVIPRDPHPQATAVQRKGSGEPLTRTPSKEVKVRTTADAKTEPRIPREKICGQENVSSIATQDIEKQKNTWPKKRIRYASREFTVMHVQMSNAHESLSLQDMNGLNVKQRMPQKGTKYENEDAELNKNCAWSEINHIRQDEHCNGLPGDSHPPFKKKQSCIGNAEGKLTEPPDFVIHPGLELLHDVTDNLEEITLTCPHVNVDVYGIDVRLLLDSGAEIDCISEGLLNQLLLTKPDLPIMPARCTKIVGAIGNRSQPSRTQVFIDVQLRDGRLLELPCLVIKNLVKPLIMGYESLKKYGAVIDMAEETCTFKFLPHPQINAIAGDHHKFYEWRLTDGAVDLNDIRTTVKDNKNLSSPQQKQLRDLLIEHAEVFSTRPGFIAEAEHEILIDDRTPFKGRTYPIPVAYQEEVDKEIQKMISWGIIEKRQTPFVNSLVVIKKKDGGVRLCVDGRELNSRTLPQRDAPPLIDDILRRYCKAEIFTTTDITASYWQIAIRECDQQFTGFTYQSCTYVFKRTPFGLKNSGSTLIRAIDEILKGLPIENVCCYIDDVLLATASFQEHFELLKEILQRFQKAGVTLKFNKSHFLQTSVKFLGHNMSKDGIQPDPQKVIGIQNYPTPKNLRQLRGFLGLCQFYSKFCPSYAYHTTPLLELLRGKSRKWCWTDAQEHAFKKVKEAFSVKITLTYPDYSKRLILQTDSSRVGLGAVLYQEDDENTPQIIAFLSRTLKGAESRYAISELEALSILWALKKLRPWILGHDLLIRTDNKSLTFLKTCPLPTGRIARWAMAMEEYNYTIEHCSGKDNKIADLLSRNPANTKADKSHIEVIRVAPTEDLTMQLRAIDRIQEIDNTWRPIKEILRGANRIDVPNFDQINAKIQYFRLSNNILEKNVGRDMDRWRICVPKGMIRPLINFYHEVYAHYGARKISILLKEKFYFEHFDNEVAYVIRRCDICQRTKTLNRRYEGIVQSIVPTKKNETVALDIFGPLVKGKRRNKYILVVIDLYSKITQVYPMRRANSQECLRALIRHYFVNFGTPERVLSDHGTTFTSDLWVSTLNDLGVQTIYSSIRHPQSNPSERSMKELGRLCRLYCHQDHTSWVDLIPHLNRWLNEVPHRSIGVSPVEAHTGQRPRRFDDGIVGVPHDLRRDNAYIQQVVRRTLEREALARRRQQKGKTYQYQVGDRVLLKTHRVSDPLRKIFAKFKLLFDGPYTLTRSHGGNAFQLTDGNGVSHGIHNSSNLRPYWS